MGIAKKKLETMTKPTELKLSTTTKLGCLSFGLPPCSTCPVKGQICKVCYASFGTARFPFVDAILQSNHRLINSQTIKQSAKQIADQLTNESYFRWFWSGDAFSKKMVSVVIATAKLTPHVKHWIATRNIAIWEGVKLPANVTFRSSSP